MKVVIAIDSFKGSLTSLEAGNIISKGIKNKKPNADVHVYPLADGGEGTVEALNQSMNGELVHIKVKGPLNKDINCHYSFVRQKKLAIIESAEVIGLPLIPRNQQNPMHTTTYGLGEVILDAINHGAENFIIGLGGSSTNDAGLGMLQALGYEFKDVNQKTVGITGKDLQKIHSIHTENVHPFLKKCNFTIAADVNNVLYGPDGATRIYATQKGANLDEIEQLDTNIKNFSIIVKQSFNKDYAHVEKTGAAGGLGYAFYAFLNGQLKAGRDVILSELRIEDNMKNVDFVITGEGKLDKQTQMGKGPIGIAKLGKKYDAKVIALAGEVTEDILNNVYIDACFSILHGPSSLENAMNKDVARYNLQTITEQIFSII